MSNNIPNNFPKSASWPGVAVDAGQVPYVPTVPGNWSPPPTDVGPALDQLAAKAAFPSPAAALQATWFIDGQNVTGLASDANSGLTALTPLRTDQERARRIGGLTVKLTMTVTLLSSLQPNDVITEPQVGLDGCFIVTGSPGTTVTHTGVLTAATAQAGNNTATVTDAAVVWGPFVGQRLRVTSGPRAGAIAWIMHDNGAHVASVSDPEIKAIDPTQFQLTSVVLAAGDPYVLETLPTIPGTISPYGAEDGENAVFAYCRLMYEGIAFPPNAFSVEDRSDDFIRQFIGCTMGSIVASAEFLACAWVQLGGQFIEWPPGLEALVCGCAFIFSGGGSGGMYIDAGAAVTFDQGTTIMGGPVVVHGWLGIGVYGGGTFIGGTAGVLGSRTDGVIVAPGGVLRADNLLWGTGNTGVGIRVQSGGSGIYVTKPTITGVAGDTIIGGTPKAYAAIPFVNATNSAMLVPLA